MDVSTSGNEFGYAWCCVICIIMFTSYIVLVFVKLNICKFCVEHYLVALFPTSVNKEIPGVAENFINETSFSQSVSLKSLFIPG